MAAYARLKEKRALTDVEMLDGNLCRCTGYRPLLTACRSLVARDAGELEHLAKLHYAKLPKPLLAYDADDAADPPFPAWLAARGAAAGARRVAVVAKAGGSEYHRATTLEEARALSRRSARV